MGGAFAGLALSTWFPIIHGYSIDPLINERFSAFLLSLFGLLVCSSFFFGEPGQKNHWERSTRARRCQATRMCRCFCG